jgi:uncharacterized membrane protein YccC
MNRAYSLAQRFGEPSSYAGIATILALAGVNIPAGEWQQLASIGCLAGSLAAALIAFFKPDVKGN